MVFIYAKSQSISKEQIFRNSWNIGFRVGDIDYCNVPQLAAVTKKLEHSGFLHWMTPKMIKKIKSIKEKNQQKLKNTF